MQSKLYMDNAREFAISSPLGHGDIEFTFRETGDHEVTIRVTAEMFDAICERIDAINS